MSSRLNWGELERRPGVSIFAIGCCLAVTYVVAVTIFSSEQGPIIKGDAVGYYAYLRSFVFDQDVNFINDYQLLYESSEGQNVWLTARTPTGHAINYMSIGPALLWLPFFLITAGVMALLKFIGVVAVLDGVSLPFQVSAGLAGICYATIGVYYCFRICERWFSPAPALWGTLLAWLATPAIYYSLVSPAYSHATSIFAVSLFVYTWLRTMGDHRVARWALLGALGGLVALVRWQDAVVAILPMAEMLRAVPARQVSVRALISAWIASGAAAVASFLPQMLAWRQIYGQWFLTPQGQDFMRWGNPQIGAVLFSPNHGLFSWTPVVLLAVIGLGLFAKRSAFMGWLSLAVVVLTVYVNASVADWWAGEAFGARRFIGNTPFFALGLAGLCSIDFLEHRARLLRVAASALIVYNLLFLLQYQLFMRGFEDLAPYPVTVKQILIDRLVVPWRAIGAALD